MEMVLIAYANSDREGSGEPASFRCSLAQYRELEKALDKEPEVWSNWTVAHVRLK